MGPIPFDEGEMRYLTLLGSLHLLLYSDAVRPHPIS